MNVSITDYGALSGGAVCTAAIQKAIDDCFRSGGGTVEIPDGVFLTGGIRLRSNITLILRSGACLKGTRDPQDYLGFLTDTLEPLNPEYLTDSLWTPKQPDQYRTREDYEFIRKPGGRWGNGLIRAIDARNISIIGESGAVIDGSDCFDETGEEFYRGPHGVSMHNCSDVHMRGYTIQNTGNWAHALFDCRNVCVEDITVLAGHDGIHMTSCDRIKIRNCEFYTGDDCVAGIDNIDVEVDTCIMNTACSAFRYGGRLMRIRNCTMYGPAKYLFRGSLSEEEKRSSKPTEAVEHRYNMLSAFTYYADFSREIREQPGDIRMENCKVNGVDRFIHYNYSGNEEWQRNRPLERFEFINVEVDDLRMPLTLYGDQTIPIDCRMENCKFSLCEEAAGMPFMHLCNYREISLVNVQVDHLRQAPLIKRWSNDGEIPRDGVVYTNADNPFVADADEPFVCRPI